MIIDQPFPNSCSMISTWRPCKLVVLSSFACILQDSEGETPIHICAREGLLGLAQTLCAFGCNVDIPNEDGMLPLHLGSVYFSLFLSLSLSFFLFPK